MVCSRSNLAKGSLLFLALTLLVGCGGEPAPTPTPTKSKTASATPTHSATPSNSPTPTKDITLEPDATPFVAPTPKTEEEKKYDDMKAKATELAFAKSYQEAIPALRECIKQRPDDYEVVFYLMLSIGSSEDEPSPKSEAYTIAKTLIEKAPGTPYAERAKDYMLSAESEPEKPIPEKDAEPIDGKLNRSRVPDPHTAYTLAVPITIYLSRNDGLSTDIKKNLWYLEVKPDGVPGDAKMKVPKGTSISIQVTKSYYFSKNSWRGGGTRAEREGQPNFDKNSFNLMAYHTTLESGPNKGTRGWFVNQMDRFKGLDDDGQRVWGVLVAPRLVVESKDKKKDDE